MLGLVSFQNIAKGDTWGAISSRISSRFAANSVASTDKPVTFPPRRARFDTSPGDGNHADREFGFANLLLSRSLRRQSRRRYAANGFAFVPKPAVQPHEHSAWQGLTGLEGASFQPQPDERSIAPA